ncbi:MAG: hypothetical protein AAGJ93_04385 [Bacteroidota bacterium]
MPKPIQQKYAADLHYLSAIKYLRVPEERIMQLRGLLKKGEAWLLNEFFEHLEADKYPIQLNIKTPAQIPASNNDQRPLPPSLQN